MKRCFLLCLFVSLTTYAQSVYFIDAGTDTMKLGNASYYEIGFRKSNGSIAYIRDKTTGGMVVKGSRNEQLWGAVFPRSSASYWGGASYAPTGGHLFSYTWSPAAAQLTLRYQSVPAAPRRLQVIVTVQASAESYCDLQLQLTNEWGDTLETLLFPSELLFAVSEVQKALLPMLPGVILKPSFFQQARSYVVPYPGTPGVFSNALALSLTSGHIGLYTLWDSEPVPMTLIGFGRDESAVGQRSTLLHSFRLYLPNNRQWTSPRIRLRIGNDFAQLIQSMRRDYGIEQLASVSSKLGSLFPKVIQAPVHRIEFTKLRTTLGLKQFKDYDSLLAALPGPSILNLVSYWPRGFDESYPDFLPPDSSFGTLSDFQSFYSKAHAQGHLLMPYTNPTWWDDESPTVRSLPAPLTLRDIVVQGADGNLLYEEYFGKGGYVVAPSHPFVKQRVEQLIQEMTVTVPSDILFQDQIGARAPVPDFHPSRPSVTGYLQEWIDHTRRFAAKRLSTELGFDRLIESHVAFFGGIRDAEYSGYTPSFWGDRSNWEYYPFAPLLASDKILFYNYPGSELAGIIRKENLTWDMTFGHQHTYDLHAGYYQSPEWLDVVTQFQARVASRYAGKLLLGYQELSPNVTQTRFDGLTIISNRLSNTPLAVDGHVIAPAGVYAKSDDGRLLAGIFTAFNGSQLSAGGEDHYLIFEFSPQWDSLVVLRPSGPDLTTMNVPRPLYWPSSATIRLSAVTADTTFQLPVTVSSTTLSFNADKKVLGKKVLRYVLTSNLVSSAEQVSEMFPREFHLYQNYPNPFNPSTTIAFDVPSAGAVSLRVFDLLGRQVATLVNDHLPPGRYKTTWDASGMPSGVYFCRIQSLGFMQTRKLILNK